MKVEYINGSNELVVRDFDIVGSVHLEEGHMEIMRFDTTDDSFYEFAKVDGRWIKIQNPMGLEYLDMISAWVLYGTYEIIVITGHSGQIARINIFD